MSKPTESEISDVLGKCVESFEEGRSRWPGMTYEQGVEAAILWMIGDSDTNPMED